MILLTVCATLPTMYSARRFPGRRLEMRQFGGLDDRVGIRAAQYVASALDRFRTFGHIANRDIRNSEDRTLFLHRAAIGEHRE